jgi:U4/U6.U5 tri-snRNP-associated protein 2
MKRSLDTTCPYLDTVNRAALDFDFEKVCSVTLQNLNVYACLVCGKFFQGRSEGTPAMLHSLEQEHHVFIHLARKTVHCLPDNYEVHDASLDDIVYLLDPVFSPHDVRELDLPGSATSLALDGSSYTPGVVGLNEIKLNDSLNCVLLALAHVRRLRDFFLIPANYAKCGSRLVGAFGEFVRKVWNRRNFKPQVSPHEVLQEVGLASGKRFLIGEQADPVQFVSWFLNALHRDLETAGVAGAGGKTVVHACFQGQLAVAAEKDVRTDEDKEAGLSPVVQRTDSKTKFLFLTLDLPPAPLFRDDSEKNIIPQVPLMVLLEKFDGQHWTEIPVELTRKAFHLTRLPPYLILMVSRFKRNRFFLEKNPTIVTFPVKSLDLAPYVQGAAQPIKYDLVSSIRHFGNPNAGKYLVAVQSKAQGAWFDIDALVVQETHPQKISLSEAYVLVYELAATQ